MEYRSVPLEVLNSLLDESQCSVCPVKNKCDSMQYRDHRCHHLVNEYFDSTRVCTCHEKVNRSDDSVPVVVNNSQPVELKSQASHVNVETMLGIISTRRICDIILQKIPCPIKGVMTWSVYCKFGDDRDLIEISEQEYNRLSKILLGGE